MSKRFLQILGAALLGFTLAAGSARLAFSLNLFPNRELNRSADYVKEVLRLVHENHVEEGEAGYERLTQEALHGLVESMDPHSEFLEAKDFKQLDEEMRGDFGGVGIQVERREKAFVVIAAMPDSPARKAGIRRADEVVAVDSRRLGPEDSMETIVQLLRGEPGTRVVLHVRRKAVVAELLIPIERDTIRIKSVRDVRMLGNGIGYLQLSEFSDRSAEEFGKALDTLFAGGMESLILDMRNNPGGLLDAAVAVAEPFFPKGQLIAYTKGRRAEDREDFRSELEGEPLSLPLVVLINSGSASAAEIVAGALKDTGRAVLVGERSFGKGSVQTIFKLRNGEGMRLTTAWYFTPSGVRIHGKGIEPAVEVVMSPAEDEALWQWRVRPEGESGEDFVQRQGKAPPVDRQLETALAILKAQRLLFERGLRVGAGPHAGRSTN